MVEMNTSQTPSHHGIAIFASHEDAEEAILVLKEAGYNLTNLSIIGQDFQVEDHPIAIINKDDRMWAWSKNGAFWGFAFGVLAQSAFLVIPGLGYVFAAGHIISIIEGVLLGAGCGAVGGALLSLGIPENDISEYESALKGGSFLLIAHGSDLEVKHARSLLAQTAATRVDTYTKDGFEL